MEICAAYFCVIRSRTLLYIRVLDYYLYMVYKLYEGLMSFLNLLLAEFVKVKTLGKLNDFHMLILIG